MTSAKQQSKHNKHKLSVGNDDEFKSGSKKEKRNQRVAVSAYPTERRTRRFPKHQLEDWLDAEVEKNQ